MYRNISSWPHSMQSSVSQKVQRASPTLCLLVAFPARLTITSTKPKTRSRSLSLLSFSATPVLSCLDKHEYLVVNLGGLFQLLYRPLPGKKGPPGRLGTPDLYVLPPRFGRSSLDGLFFQWLSRSPQTARIVARVDWDEYDGYDDVRSLIVRT